VSNATRWQVIYIVKLNDEFVLADQLTCVFLFSGVKFSCV